MAAPTELFSSNPVRNRILLWLLAGLHAPWLFRYFHLLWTLPHYEFFPFAIISFLLLFKTRRSTNPTRWTWPSKALIAADVIFLAVGICLDSPWLVAVGSVCGLTAICVANTETSSRRSLAYLALLPLSVIRLPLLYDEQAIHWLQRMTTAAASRGMNQFAMLHYRSGNILHFPGRNFMVEEACSGVQSLFTILFLAAFLICLKRRSVVHSLLLMGIAVFDAGFLNILRVSTVAVAWEHWSTDLSTGLTHELLGYAFLTVAAMLLLSADAFLGFFTEFVPDFRLPGASSVFLNPLIRCWNLLVAVRPLSGSSDSVPIRRQGTVKSSKGPDAQEREYPSFGEFIRPRNLFAFMLGTAESWLFSRSYRQLAAGAPFAVIACGMVLAGWWLLHRPIDPVLALYEAACREAVSAGNVQKQETYLRALCSLRPSVHEYRFRLGQFFLQTNRVQEGLNQIVGLALENQPGYAEARLWLAQQAFQPNPLVSLTMSQIETQLKAVVDLTPNNSEAHLLLYRLYRATGELKLAERHLAVAAASMPEMKLALAQVKQLLNRDPAEIRKYAEEAIPAIAGRLELDRSSVSARIVLAEACAAAGQEAAARDVLIAGLRQKDEPELRRALSNLDIAKMTARLNESTINRDACVPVALNALQLDPGNAAAARLIISLHELGAAIPPESISSAIQYWQKTVDQSADDLASRVLLSLLLDTAGETEQAAECLAGQIDQHPELRLGYCQFLLQIDRHEEADPLLDVLQREAQMQLDADPKDVAAAAQAAEVQLLRRRFDDVRTLLSQFAANPQTSLVPADPVLAEIYGRACISMFDSLTPWLSDGGSEEIVPKTSAGDPGVSGGPVEAASPKRLLQLLAEAMSCRPSTLQAIDRAAKLSLSSHPAAAGAESMLHALRLEGAAGVEALNLQAMHALFARRYDKARDCLEQANVLTRGKSPMIMNNLAMAIIRGGGDTKERALDLANQVITLIPDHPDALMTRGEIFVSMKQWEDALADLTQALELRRNSEELHRLLEKAYTGLGNAEMAAQHQQRAAELAMAQASQ